ncbi:MAG: hypothetical protein RBG13Loki_4295, partial [Promethearchaeota archaeon CR_4]
MTIFFHPRLETVPIRGSNEVGQLEGAVLTSTFIDQRDNDRIGSGFIGDERERAHDSPGELVP